jgi:hypothetical protein
MEFLESTIPGKIYITSLVPGTALLLYRTGTLCHYFGTIPVQYVVACIPQDPFR